MKRGLFVVLLVLTSAFFAQSQSYNEVAGQEGSRVITTAVPFLIITKGKKTSEKGASDQINLK